VDTNSDAILLLELTRGVVESPHRLFAERDPVVVIIFEGYIIKGVRIYGSLTPTAITYEGGASIYPLACMHEKSYLDVAAYHSCGCNSDSIFLVTHKALIGKS